MLRVIRVVLPGTYGADVLAVSFRHHVPWGSVGIDLLVCFLVALVSLWAGGWALRRLGSPVTRVAAEGRLPPSGRLAA